MLTLSDLRWMEEHRQRAALGRMLEKDDRTLAELGLHREEVREVLDRAQGGDVCAAARGRPALAHRLGCPV
jgi:uncharacterized protein YjiS (DUF1127 family)